MKRRKVNMLPVLLGLCVLLIAACMIGSAGTSFARYREDIEASILFAAREQEYIVLGQLETDGDKTKFVPADGGQWQLVTEEVTVTVEPTEATTLPGQEPAATTEPTPQTTTVTVEKLQMVFTVANGRSENDHADEDQKALVRFVGSPDVWDGRQTIGLKLILPPEKEGEKNVEIPAEVSRIGKDTALYRAFGDGWVFSFYDEWEQEYSWDLEGGKLSYATVTVELDDAGLGDLSLLQLLVTGDYTKS